MLAILKRYSMALVFLIAVVVLMLLGTIGVTMFGDKMIADTGGQAIQPRGEKLVK